MGAGSSLYRRTPKHIRSIMKKHVHEKTKVSVVRGNFAWPFVSAKFFYKINEFKHEEDAKAFHGHLASTRKKFPTEHVCHALECTLVDNHYVLSKYHRHMGDLFELRNKLTFEQLSRVLLSLVSGLIEVHSMGVVHGDVKPENILVTHNYKAILCDLDNMEKPTQVKSIGTEYYSPPVGLFREGLAMAKSGEVTYYELYAMVDMFGVAATIQALLLNRKTRNVHRKVFWERVVQMMMETNLKYFFNDRVQQKMVRAIDCIPIMTYFNIAPVEEPTCDCSYRPEWSRGCLFCDYGSVEEIEVRRVESVEDDFLLSTKPPNPKPRIP